MRSNGWQAQEPAASEELGEGPVEVIAGTAKGGILLICDHTSNRIPRPLGSLGLAPLEGSLHVAWDIGAAALTRGLAARLGVPAILTGTSRLVIDCNRAPTHPASIPAVSHGIAVPGNRDLAEAEAQRRRTRYFDPYHATVAAALEGIEAAGGAPALVSLHSFTPVLADMARHWHVGVLSDRDRRLADFFLASLRSESGLVVGDNEPYSGRHPEGYSCPTHGDARGRLNVLIEVRQDLVSDDIGIDAWIERLARVLNEGVACGFRPGAGGMTSPVQAA